MTSHGPPASTRLRAVSGTRGDDLALSGSAGSEPGLSSPRLLPVPSAWWETPAVTSCVLAARPESAGTARHFTREVFISWGFGQLVDEAETIIGELVVNAVQHGTHDTAGHSWRGTTGRARGTNGYPRARARAAWGSHGNAGGDAMLRLCLLRRVGEVMLAVIDASDDAPMLRQPDWVKESGRGLQIVHALSSVWGWSPIEGHGKAVWAVLPYQGPAPSAGLSMPNGPVRDRSPCGGRRHRGPRAHRVSRAPPLPAGRGLPRPS